jgi:hypothetical protein
MDKAGDSFFSRGLNGGFSIITAAAMSLYPLTGIAGSPEDAEFVGAEKSGDQILAAVSGIPHKLQDAALMLPCRLDRIAVGLRNGSPPLFNGSRVPEPVHDEEVPEAAFQVPAGTYGLPPGARGRGGHTAEEFSQAGNRPPGRIPEFRRKSVSGVPGKQTASAAIPGDTASGGGLPGKPRIRRISGWDNAESAF